MCSICTNQLSAQALELAAARYNLGLSSIVQLAQAQLNKTRADIGQAPRDTSTRRGAPRSGLRPAMSNSDLLEREGFNRASK